MPILRSYVDSMTYGDNASDYAHQYPSIVSTTISATDERHAGRANYSLNICNEKIYPYPVSSGDIAIGLFGYNDIRMYGIDADTMYRVTHEVAVGCAYLSIPDENKIRPYPDFASISLAGEWYGSPLHSTGRASRVTGSTMQKVVKGQSIIIAASELELPNFNTLGSFKVEVDGILKATFSGQHGTNITSVHGGNPWGSNFIIINGLTDDNHSLVITHTGTGTDGTNSNFIEISWFAGITNDINYNKVVLGGVCRMDAVGYTMSTLSGSSDANVVIYNNAFSALVNDIRSTNLPVKFFDPNIYYDITTGLDTDHVHPNNTGHAQLATGFLQYLADSIDAPILSVSAGTYNIPFIETITCNTNSVVMYYSLDGSNPTESSNIYSSSFIIGNYNTETLKVVAKIQGISDSPITSAIYNFNNWIGGSISATTSGGGGPCSGTYIPSNLPPSKMKCTFFKKTG